MINKYNELTQYVPERYWGNDEVQKLIYEKLTNRLNWLEEIFEEIVNNAYIEDMNEEALSKLEKEFKIKPSNGMTLEDRKAFLLSILRGIGVTNVEKLKNIAKSYDCGDIDVIQNYSDYYVLIKFMSRVGVPKRIDDLKMAIEKAIPCHLGVSYAFKYTTWGDLLSHTWGEMKPRTWEQARGTDNKPHIILTVDDGNVLSDSLKQMIQHYNAKCCYAIVPENVGKAGFMTLDQIKQLKSEGNDIIAHGTTQLTKDNAETILKDTRDYMLANGIATDVYVYPDGNEIADKKIIEAETAKYFKYGLNVVVGSTTETPDNVFDMPRMFVSNVCNLSVSWVKDIIDDALTYYKTIIIGIHGWNFDETKPYIEEILNYMIAKKAVIKTFSEIFE